jgi:hypothetical protein
MKSRLRFLLSIFAAPRLAGRTLRRRPAFLLSLLLIVALQYAMAVYLLAQRQSIAVLPASYLIAAAIPVRMVVSLLFASAILHGILHLMRSPVAWRLSLAIVAHAGLVLVAGDLVKLSGGMMSGSVRGASLPGIATLIHLQGIPGVVLGEMHLFMAWFVVVFAFMIASVARLRIISAAAVSLSVWCCLVLARVAQFSLLSLFFH